jgi:hypothetical protein
MIRFEAPLLPELDAAVEPHAMHETTDTPVRHADDLRVDGPHSTPLTIISATSVRSSRGTLNTRFVLLRTANTMRQALHAAVGLILP